MKAAHALQAALPIFVQRTPLVRMRVTWPRSTPHCRLYSCQRDVQLSAGLQLHGA